MLREWILGWDRDRSTAASSGDRALRPKASIRGIAASSSGAIFGLRLCGFDIGRQLAPFFGESECAEENEEQDHATPTGCFELA